MFGLAGIRLYGALAVILAFVGMGIALKVQNARLDAVQQEYAGFRAQVTAAGEAAKAAAEAKKAEYAAIKSRIDNENQTLRDNLAATAERLRNARAGISFLPTTPGTTPSPDYAADRAELEAALRNFDTAVARLIDEGDAAIADVNAAKDFIKSINK